MRLLHLDSSALGQASVSRQLTAEIVSRQRALHPGLDVTYRDLAADPALHLSGAHLAVMQGAPSEDALINADLANELGNLAQRSLSMVAKNLDGTVPTPGEFTDEDSALLALADALLGGGLGATRLLLVALLAAAAMTVLGHVVAILTSSKLR